MRTSLSLLLLMLHLACASWAQQAVVWVSTKGSDAAEGTKEKPLASVSMALRKVREMRRLANPAIANGAHIYVSGGTYFLNEPILVHPEDAGTVQSPTVIEAAPSETPILSGGVELKGWQKVKASVAGLPKQAIGKLWVADAPEVGGNLLEFRQLWINGKKATRAKDTSFPLMNRILTWNKQEQTCWIPTPNVGDLSQAKGLEFFIHQWWAIAILRIKQLEAHGDSTKVYFHQPESRIQSEHPWPAPWISKETGNSAYYLANAIQFLNEPGEWFLDRKTQKIYYYPRANEVMETALVVAPSLETLVNIAGSADAPVAYVHWKGISFQHSSWRRPSQWGYVPHQAGLYMTDAYKLRPAGTPDKKSLENQAWVGRPASAVEVSFANFIHFEQCRFEHLAATGLDYHKGVHHSLIQGNLFKDVGGTGIMAGEFSDETTEIHLPYQPTDEREVSHHLTISNNLITDATNEDWGCVGIGAGYIHDCQIAHNEISEVSYSGISLGWGWTPTLNVMKNNRVVANKIHHYAKHNYDAAAIYTLSAQPGTVISENYVDSIYKAPYAHIPTHWFYLYTDEGSSYMTLKNNWTPSEKYLQNANGPGNVWQNNGPQVADSIRHQAGIQPLFQYLWKSRVDVDKLWKINREQPVVVELVVPQNQPLNETRLREVLTKSKVKPEAVFRWENHWLIFDKVQDVFVLRERLKSAFPEVTLKTYDEPFYEFNQGRCQPAKIAKEWEHTLLTANLVADTALQNQYLQYHAAQFEKWPEIAQGFCNGRFQQLLLYKNGRQLVLVISTPKGESLEKLNPKTTENNPKMDEWNALMKKYQEGIEGTKPGEVWVFLAPAVGL